MSVERVKEMKTKKNELTPKQEKLKAALAHLRELKNFLTPDNWIQETYDNEAGSYCLIGASRVIDGPGENKAQQIMKKVARTYKDEYGLRPASVEQFNDDIAKEFSDIQEFLKRSIKEAKAQFLAAA